MATGLGNQLTKQIAEHLVTAYLGRMGIIATPFAGNVPEIDILAHANGISCHIQVKAINKGDWQFDARKFLNIELKADGQRVLGSNENLDRGIICVFVKLGHSFGEDTFYIFRWGVVQDHIESVYRARVPPRNMNSFHCRIREQDLLQYRENWRLIKDAFLP